MVQVAIADLPTTQFTVGPVAKMKNCTLKEAREALDRLVDQGKLTVKVAGSGARNYKLQKAGTAKKSAPRSAAAPRSTSTVTAHKDGSQEQYDAAKGESKLLKEWERSGGKGKRPETPNYDAIAAKSAANGGRTPSKKSRAKKDGGDSAPRGTTVRFVVDGKPMPDSQNKLSSVAWYHTAGVCGDDSPRCSVTELRKILADVRPPIVDPSNEVGWTVTLSNGKEVSTVAL